MGEAVVSEPVVVPNPEGFHARPAAVLAGMARRFRSEIEMVRGADRTNARSVVGLMALEVKKGDAVTFSARGADAGEAVQALARAVQEGLGEGTSTAKASVAKGKAAAPAPAAVVAPHESEPGVLRGVAASPGLAVGQVFHLRRQEIEVVEQGGEPARERRTLEHALDQARSELELLEGRLAAETDATQAAIFAAHREILDDPDLTEPVWQAIQGGSSAGFAWKRAYAAQAERLASLGNPLLSARAHDIRDVGERVLRLLLGVKEGPLEIPAGSILVAEDLSPSDTANLDRTRVLGFATLLGGATSHVAILARSLELPAVVAMDPRAAEIAPGTLLILDGTQGRLRVDPPAAEVEQIRQRQKEAATRRAELLARAGEPAVTQDGKVIEVAANLGTASEAQKAVEMGAEGVGLLRSEFLFLGRETPPSEDEQAELYTTVARAFGPERRLIVRTLDVGGDKPLPYLPIPPEDNPFLGERGIRALLARPELLRMQFRAILRAAGLARLGVMLPMVTNVDELRKARAMFDEERAKVGNPAVEFGIMIEVPAAALTAEVLAREADFFSIGTNDLTQYTLAVDRGHPRLAAMADGLHPAVLRLVKFTVEAAHAHGRWVGVCGGTGGDPHAIPILVGLGVDELSVTAPSVPAVKAAIRELTVPHCRDLAEKALALESAAAVRALVEVKG